MRSQRDARQEGFTLIEMMIAVACLGILIGAVRQSTIGWLETTATDAYVLRATTAMESEMDRLRAAKTLPAAGPFKNSELALIPTAEGRRFYEPVKGKLMRVTLIVRWQQPGKEPRNLSIVSLFTDSGAKR